MAYRRVKLTSVRALPGSEPAARTDIVHRICNDTIG